MFAAAGIPGAILGTFLVKLMPRGTFDVAFGVLLLALGVYLLLRPVRPMLDEHAPSGAAEPMSQPRDRVIGAAGSAVLGLFASLMGIGGGILHVPFLIRVLKFPPHRATATSHFVLAIVSFAAVVSHLLAGELNDLIVPTAYLALGVMMGAPAGAALSTRVSGSILIRLLAIAIVLVALRLLWPLVF